MSRTERSVLAFTALYLSAASIAAFRGGNSEFVLYIVVMLVLGAATFTVLRRVNLHPATLWGLSLWGLAHVLGGLLPVGDSVLYNLQLIPRYLRYDQLIHGLGFALCTWICWQGLSASLQDPKPTFGRLTLAALASMGLGAVNEVVEFVATLALPETNVGGYVNTGWDLVANATGAILAAVLIGRLGGRG